MRPTPHRLTWLPAFAALLLSGASFAQPTPSGESPGGKPHRVHALVGGAVAPRPGVRLETGTILVRDGLIAAVGSGIAIPSDARVWDMRGLTITAGLIEPYLLDDGEAPKSAGARHPNPAVTPERDMASELALSPEQLEELRAAGFTAALLVPGRGVLRGASVLVSLRDGDPREQVLRARVAQHLAFERQEGGYPGSEMGAIALTRQALLDAEHHVAAREAFARKPLGQARPEASASLRALAPVLAGTTPVFLQTDDAQAFVRGARVLSEFELVPWGVIGACDAYRWVDALAKTGAPLVLSLNTPPPPEWEGEAGAVDVDTEQLREWWLAPESPALLEAAKVRFSFTTHGLASRGEFRARVREAVERGLSPEQALAAFTTGPAALVSAPQLGVIAPGTVANLTVTDGEPFAEDTEVVAVWVDGAPYRTGPPLPALKALAGRWALSFEGGARLELEAKLAGGELVLTQAGAELELSLRGDRVEFVLPGAALGLRAAAAVRCQLEGRVLRGTWEAPADGFGDTRTGWVLGRVSAPEPSEPKPAEGASAETPTVALPAPWPPLPEPAPPAVLVRGATVWTLGPQGTLEGADLLCRGGVVSQVGYDLEAPEGALIVDGSGRHVTPGIVDCHSHSFISGGVNEGTHTCTAEVRVGDVINAETRRIYQQLAGGVTTANLLHGSANAIGGQSAVVQLRWGKAPHELRFEGATPGIKFALGENPKRSNWGHGLKPRYPTTRMGVQESIRERFQAARDYQRKLQAWRLAPSPDAVPPRIDLQLQALVEILEGRRKVHCHSYRQDEILALIRLAESFGFTIGTFQHVLEGYKVAEAIAAHGAGASTFSDWWAYKFEVYDAIGFNGAIMARKGVLVSFNSDSSELARRLNQEAGKAVRYGGLAEDEALKFVTLNPALQLGVGDRVGSLEAGKQADFVLWSAHPLQALARCEQTWIAGQRYYEWERDLKAYAASTVERRGLLAAARRAESFAWTPTFFRKPKPEPKDESCHGGQR